MKRIVFLLLVLSGCGAVEQISYPTQDGCHPWVKVQDNWCGGLWIRACKFGESKCTYQWECRIQSLIECHK